MVLGFKPTLSVYLMAWQETKNIIFINSWLFTMEVFYFFPVKSWLPSEDLIQVPLPSSKWITNVSNFKRQFASMLTVVEIQTTLASLRKLQKNYHKNNNINSLQKSHCFPPLWKEAMASSIEWDIWRKRDHCLYFDTLHHFSKTSTNNALFQGFSQSKCKIIK